MAVLFELSSEANRSGSSRTSGLLQALGGMLGLLQCDPATYLHAPSRYQTGSASGGTLTIDQIEALVQARTHAKQERDFDRADQLRAELRAAGVELEDKPGGSTQWRRA